MQETFAEWLQQQRTLRHYSRMQLAELLGLPVESIEQIETQGFLPSRQLARRIFDFFVIPLQQQHALFEQYANQFSLPLEPQLPTPQGELFGRDDLVEQICQAIGHPHRLVSVIGLGGMGKTRLALEAAQRLIPRFIDGVFFIDLTSLSDPALLLLHIAKAFKIVDLSPQSVYEKLVSLLLNKRVLLLIDPIEHVLPSLQDLQQLVNRLPSLHILLTSRVMLHLQNETTFLLEPLDLPVLQQEEPTADSNPSYLAALAANPSVALFVDRARAISPQFQLNEGNAEAIAKLCTRLEGIPLAIELAAVHLRIFSPQGLLKLLEESVEGFSNYQTKLPHQHQTMRMALDWSYRAIPLSAQILLRRMALFPNGALLEMIEQVCTFTPSDSPELPRIDVMENIVILLDHNLLLRRESDSFEIYFAMLETVREYALEQLDKSAERGQLFSYIANYYFERIRTISPSLTSHEAERWIQHLDQHYPNIRAILVWALQERGDPVIGLKIVAAIWRYWDWCSMTEEGCLWVSLALEAVPEGFELERAHTLQAAGWLSRVRWEPAVTLDLLEQSLKLFRSLGQVYSTVDVLTNLVTFCFDIAEYEQAERYADELLPMVRELDRPIWAAWALIQMTRIALWRNELHWALEISQEALRLARSVQHKRAIGWAMYYVSRVMIRFYNYEEAIRMAEESATLFRQINYYYGAAISMHALAETLQFTGDTTRAIEVIEESLSLRRDVEDTYHMARISLTRGRIAEAKHNYSDAYTYYDDARRLFEKIDEPTEVAWALYGLSRVGPSAQDLMTIRRLLDRFTKEMQRAKQHVWAAWGAGLRDMVLIDQNPEETMVLVEQNLAAVRQSGDAWALSSALQCFVRAISEIPERRYPYSAVREGLQLAYDLGDYLSLSFYTISLACFAWQRECWEEAAWLCGSAQMLCERVGVGYCSVIMPRHDKYLMKWISSTIRNCFVDENIAEAWARGRNSSIEDGLHYALAYLERHFELGSYLEELQQVYNGTQQASSANDLETFAYTVSHDLRAPLQAIDGYTRILIEDLEESLSEEAQHVYSIIRNETGRMRELIDKLVSFARFGHAPINLEPIPMNDMIQAAFVDVTANQDLTRIQLELDELPAALGDMILVRQIWVNLLSNALKYSSHRPKSIIRISATTLLYSVTYKIEDNGVGFDMQQAHRLFGVFQRLHSDKEFSGVGVGLAIVQRIIQRHGGRIWAESVPGQGATFYFTLPKA